MGAVQQRLSEAFTQTQADALRRQESACTTAEHQQCLFLNESMSRNLMCSCSLASQPCLHASTNSFALINPVMIDSVSWTDNSFVEPIAMSTGANCHVHYVLSVCVKILFTLTCCSLAPLSS